MMYRYRKYRFAILLVSSKSISTSFKPILFPNSTEMGLDEQ
jgi:hypothetical protein